MCQKGNIFKQFYALVLKADSKAIPKSLHVFKLPPSMRQIELVMKNVEVTKTSELHVIPIQVPVNILF